MIELYDLYNVNKNIINFNNLLLAINLTSRPLNNIQTQIRRLSKCIINQNQSYFFRI